MALFPRYNLERVVYGRMENVVRESETKYAIYAKQKEQEKVRTRMRSSRMVWYL